MNRILRLFEMLVAGLLIYSGLHHIVNPYQFAATTAAYELLPLSWLQVLPFILAALMICLGLCFVSRACIESARWIGFGMLASFAAAQTFAWVTDKQISCGCFGFSDNPISLLSISVPTTCALICFANIWIGGERSSQPAGEPDVSSSKPL